MKTLLIVDTETTGLDPQKDTLIEVAWAEWSITHRTVLQAQSELAYAMENPAIAVNGITPAMLADRPPPNLLRGTIYEAVCMLKPDAIVAHNADFDRQWLPELGAFRWICSKDDVEYPRSNGNTSLVALALAHGVGVVSAHRALDDVLTLCRLFERVAELTDFDAFLARGLRPSATFEVADKRFSEERNALAKEKGFRWDPATKSWRRRLAREDATRERLGFDVREARS